MGKDNKSQTINIDGKEYDVETFSDEQKMLVNHCVDLDRKIGSTRFQLDQLVIGRDAFVNMLKKSLEEADKAEVVETVQ